MMSKRAFSLRYGKGEISFEIPSHQLLYELKGRNHTPHEDLAGAYFHALNHPIDSPPLKELIKPGNRVAITVSDVTRGWQKNEDTLPLLIEVLNQAGVSDDDITVIIAVGAHRQNTEEEFVELCSHRGSGSSRRRIVLAQIKFRQCEFLLIVASRPELG